MRLYGVGSTHVFTGRPARDLGVVGWLHNNQHPAGGGTVKANPGIGMGAMAGVTYVQRVALKGGVVSATACNTANKGTQERVKYQADYIFWKAV